MIACNSLTGLSVVRGGRVQLSACDVIQNGTDPISIEDHFVPNTYENNNDFRNQHFFPENNSRILAGVDENNFEYIEEDDTDQEDMQNENCTFIHGNRMRDFNPAFIHSVHRPFIIS